MKPEQKIAVEQIARLLYRHAPAYVRRLQVKGDQVCAARWEELTEGEREDCVRWATEFLRSLSYNGLQIVDERQYRDAVIASRVGWEIG